jgi:hypothetical protein
VFLARPADQSLAESIAAVEQVIARPAYHELALAPAAGTAQRTPDARGVFMGYDFHLGRHGPQRIELNTSASGALLKTALARAVQRLRLAARSAPPRGTGAGLRRHVRRRMERPARQRTHGMDTDRGQRALATWRRSSCGSSACSSTTASIQAAIADAARLEWRDGRRRHEGAAVDLVYSCLTDFHLQEPRYQALRQAYEADAVVLTPHPQAHALYANQLPHAGWRLRPRVGGLSL